MTKRKAITDKMKWQSLLYWSTDAYCPECSEPILATDNIEWDHRHPIALGGTHTFDNIRAVHRECHRLKTSGSKATSAGSDIHMIAKANRIARGGKVVRRPMRAGTRKIPSRPFGR